jgi:hypothetical protein
VNRLLSIVPLETLQGWPEVADPTPLQSLALLVGAPLLVTLVIIALVQIRHSLTKRYGAESSESAWAGTRPEAVATAGVPPTSMDTSKAEGPPESTGGASGRW